MNALAVIFRLLSLLSLVGLAAFLWLQLDTGTNQNESFLDEVVSGCLHHSTIGKRGTVERRCLEKTAFNDVFDANEQVGPDDENPLEVSVVSLRPRGRDLTKPRLP